jgi:protease-4
MKNEIFMVTQSLKKKILLWRLLAFFGIFLVFAVLLGKSRNHFKKLLVGGKEESIARVNINGVIMNGLFSNDEMEKLKKPEVKAIILAIDSPGGDVAESEKLHSFFRELSKTKPVVSVIGGAGVSGSYMVAMAGNHLVARNTSIIGSIGVILQSYELTSLADKIGISFNSYKSSPLKASPNPFEKTTADVDLVVNQLVGEIYQYFLDVFIERRNIKALEAQEIADGQVYSGRQALELGLVDSLGGEEVALKYFEDSGVNVNKIKVVDHSILYHKKYDFLDLLINKFYEYCSATGNNGMKSRVMAIYGN